MPDEQTCDVCGCALTTDYADHVGYEELSNDDACIAFLKATRDLARAALARYGVHDPDCPKRATTAAKLRAALAGDATCVCGLDEALGLRQRGEE